MMAAQERSRDSDGVGLVLSSDLSAHCVTLAVSVYDHIEVADVRFDA